MEKQLASKCVEFFKVRHFPALTCHVNYSSSVCALLLWHWDKNLAHYRMLLQELMLNSSHGGCWKSTY